MNFDVWQSSQTFAISAKDQGFVALFTDFNLSFSPVIFVGFGNMYLNQIETNYEILLYILYIFEFHGMLYLQS